MSWCSKHLNKRVYLEPLDRKLALLSHRVAMTKPVKQVACVLGFGFVGVIFGFAAALNALEWIAYDTAVRVGPLTVVVAPLIPSTEWQAVQLASGSWKTFRPFAASPRSRASFVSAATSSGL